ncbi:MAG: ketoacyl-ACP synthase III [Chloroflexi bacterium]|nr:ketoacyl-ACP synthase III [Chloroflexota bacterium]MBV9895710.1 ketoacyl-ACP synthase III [Chloroflexota bacterium]
MTDQRYVRISGWGKYLPARVMPNSEVAELVDTSDEWIRARTGIRERRIAAPEETTCSLAVNAARAALDKAQVAPEDLDLVLVATCTPDYANMPATASLVQHALGAPRAAAVDMNAVCSGFIYALATGSQFVATGAYKNVLVIGAEVFTRILDWQDRSTCVLFGDGAGAVVLQPTNQPGGLISFVLGSDGAGACSLYVPAGGSRQPASADSVADRAHYVKMLGRDVFRFATRVLPDSVVEALAAASMTTDDIDVLIPHQANTRIIDHAVKRLHVDASLVFSNVERYGNTSAASIPVALCEAIECGMVRPGATVVLSGFGAGLSWGTVVWKWHA